MSRVFTIEFCAIFQSGDFITHLGKTIPVLLRKHVQVPEITSLKRKRRVQSSNILFIKTFWCPSLPLLVCDIFTFRDDNTWILIHNSLSFDGTINLGPNFPQSFAIPFTAFLNYWKKFCEKIFWVHISLL